MTATVGCASREITGAELLVQELSAQGTKVVFGYPGGAIMPVYDALLDSDFKHVLCRHEQGAALAAGGYARKSGRVGVCLSTSGPGATNMLTGIADAFMDSVPIVAITGQVATSAMGTDAFQEVDVFGMSLPVVKHSWVVRRIEDLESIVREAFHVACTGRPGPVLIDLPKDVAMARLPDGGSAVATATPDLIVSASDDDLDRAVAMLSASRRPIVYAGGGIALSGAVTEFRQFVTRMGIPTVTTLHGIGALPTGHPQLLGMLGMHGTRAANLAVQESDLLIAMGARFDDRVTGKLDEFAPLAKVLHLDIDRAEFGKRRQACVSLPGDLLHTLERFEELDLQPARCEEWRDDCMARQKRHKSRYDAPGDGVYAPEFLRALTAPDPGRWTITCDVGQHQMWVAQHAHFDDPRQHLSSGGLGTMGFGLPAAIGAQMVDRTADVVAVCGDGSFMMNVQELATINRYKLPVKIVVMDNQCLGMVRQWQELFFRERYSEVDLSDNPDFCAVARAFGVPAIRIDRREQVATAVDLLETVEGPLLLHIPIDMRENVWPLVPPNSANDHMLEDGATCST